MSNEEALFNLEIQQVKDWWTSERFKNIKRPYTPEQGSLRRFIHESGLEAW
jgi:isocitrate lyase